MPTWITVTLTILGWIATPLLSFLVGRLTIKKQKAEAADELNKQEQNAIKEACRYMLRESLKESYQYYMQEGWCSLEHKDEVEQTYQIYHKLGGNGRGTTLRDDIMRLPSYPPAANNDQQNNQ